MEKLKLGLGKSGINYSFFQKRVGGLLHRGWRAVLDDRNLCSGTTAIPGENINPIRVLLDPTGSCRITQDPTQDSHV